jgi:hypothetical protein
MCVQSVHQEQILYRGLGTLDWFWWFICSVFEKSKDDIRSASSEEPAFRHLCLSSWTSTYYWTSTSLTEPPRVSSWATTFLDEPPHRLLSLHISSWDLHLLQNWAYVCLHEPPHTTEPPHLLLSHHKSSWAVTSLSEPPNLFNKSHPLFYWAITTFLEMKHFCYFAGWWGSGYCSSWCPLRLSQIYRGHEEGRQDLCQCGVGYNSLAKSYPHTDQNYHF